MTERKYGEHDRHIGVIFATLKKMLTLPKPKLKVRRGVKTGKIGF